MCRLIALTDTSFNESMRKLIFDQLMIRSVADGDQSHGAGVSDGKTIIKSPKSYSIVGSEWLSQLDKKRLWIGHVRRASKGTSVGSVNAAHPFYYESGLIGIHNGYISNTQFLGTEFEVDSYHALKTLSSMLKPGLPITPLLLEQWISTFGEDSECTFMLLWNEELWVVRGNRPMAYATIGNGYVFNTSFDVLAKMQQWLQFFSKDYSISNIKFVPEWTAYCINTAQQKFDTHSLNRNLLKKRKPAQLYILKNGIEERQDMT